MAYRQRNITGTSYMRIHSLELLNDDGSPKITFREEEVLDLGTEKIAKSRGVFCADLAGRAQEEFPLINPATGATIGTAKVKDMYVLANSLYWYLAGLRDAGTLNPPPSENP